MKILTVSALLCTLMVTTRAAYILEEEGGEDGVDGEGGEGGEGGEENEVEESATSCPPGWTQFSNYCLNFFSKARTWAKAEKFCQSMSGNLASVHDILLYHEIQKVMMHAGHAHEEAWIGGSDAQQEGVWLWSDGSRFLYTNWCPGEPNDHHNQHCLQINYGGKNCWDDRQCQTKLPFICGKNL